MQRCGGQADHGHGPCAESLPAAAEYHGAVDPSQCFMMRIVNGNSKNPDGQGVQSRDFFVPCAKKYYSALTVWIGGTDIERGLFAAGRCAILGSTS